MDSWLKSGTTTPNESNDYSSNQQTGNNEINDESTSILKEPVKKKARKTRKYDKNILNLDSHGLEMKMSLFLLCVICFENLTNKSMKPSNLKRHFETNHNQYKDKPIDFFENKLKDLNQSRKVMWGLTGGDNQKILEASYRVSLLIAKCSAAETIGEILIKPAAKIMAEVMIGDRAKQTFDRVPLSNNTVHRRIIDMSNNVKQMLLSDISQSRYYALQVDEFTDIVNFANLMAFVRYEKNQEIHDDFLFCQPFLGHTTGEDIFNVMNKFMQENKIDWNRCVGISTDGAKSMVGINKGLVARIQNVAPNVISTHCCIHREALATRKMPADLQKVLDESVKIVNYIKNRPLNARLFSQICEEMGSNHTQLLFHTDVRWLSRGKILNRLFELRHELQCFLNDRFELRNCLHDWKWLCKLAYLADIFSVLNCLNLSLQGKEISLFHVQDKVNAAIAKLNLWQKRVGNGEVDSFPSLHEFITSSATKIDADTLKCITQHLESLQEGLKNYFPDLNKNIEWIRYPFNINTKSMPEGLSHAEEEQLLELVSDGFLKNKYKECTLTSFWLQMQHVYPVLTEKVLKYILPFPASYLCEVAFSAFVDIKSKKKEQTIGRGTASQIKINN